MGMREAERALKMADNSQKIVMVITLGQLKTIQSDAVVRQGNLRKLARNESDNYNWDIAAVANIEADKSYDVGTMASMMLSSLAPERIDDEWINVDGDRIMRRKDIPEDSPFYRVNE